MNDPVAEARMLIAEAYRQTGEALILFTVPSNSITLKRIAEIRNHLNAATGRIVAAETIINQNLKVVEPEERL